MSDSDHEVKPLDRIKRELDSDEENGVKDDPNEPIQSRLRAKKAKTSNIYSSSSEEEISDDEKGKRSKKNKKSMKSAKKGGEEDDMEEGEVSEDSSDEGRSSPEYDDGYDDEDLMGDEDDRAKLAKMTEREREMEILRRLEYRATMKRRYQIEKRLKKRHQEIKAVNETSARSRERRLMIGTTKDAKAFEKLKSAREEKKNRVAEVEKKKAAGVIRIKKEDEDSDEEEKEEDIPNVERKRLDETSSDSDNEMDDATRREIEERSAKLEPIERMEEIAKICISRDQLIHWSFYPMYLETIKGCYVRVNCGDSDAKGNIIYRLAEILGTVEVAEKYSVAETGKQPMLTKTALKLKILEKEREMLIKFVSNGKVCESEFEYFTTKMENRKMALPTRGQIESKAKDILVASRYRMTDEDITRKMNILSELNGGPLTKNLALRKSDLIKDLQDAKARKDFEEVTRVQEELDEINRKLQVRDAGRAKEQARLEQINLRNNTIQLIALDRAMKSKDREEATVRQEDPFTRRWGTPTLVHKKGGNNPTVAPNVANSPAAVVKTDNAASKTVVPAADDPFSMHNFDINIDIGDDFPLLADITRRK